MNISLWALPVSACFFLLLLLLLEAGFRLGRRRAGAVAAGGTGAMEAAVYGLLGLLLAFSFAGASGRLDQRRQLIVEEANAIGTAYLRLDLLPAADQPVQRRLFRQYLDSRLRVYALLPDGPAAEAEMEHTVALQNQIWSEAVQSSRSSEPSSVALLLLPALNQMIDCTTSRAVALRTHLPSLILFLLIAVALLSALLAGHSMGTHAALAAADASLNDAPGAPARRSWLHTVVYALTITVTLYAVIDLDQPRSGLIQLQAADSALTKLRDSIR